MLSSGSGSIEKCGTWPWGGNGSAAIECVLRAVYTAADAEGPSNTHSQGQRHQTLCAPSLPVPIGALSPQS